MNRARDKDTIEESRMFARMVRAAGHPDDRTAGGWPWREVAAAPPGGSDRVGRPRLNLFGSKKPALPEPIRYVVDPYHLPVEVQFTQISMDEWEALDEEDRAAFKHGPNGQCVKIDLEAVTTGSPRRPVTD